MNIEKNISKRNIIYILIYIFFNIVLIYSFTFYFQYQNYKLLSKQQTVKITNDNRKFYDNKKYDYDVYKNLPQKSI